MKEISPSQRKILIITFATLLAFLIFWLLVYLPSTNRVRLIKTELAVIENQLQEIKAIISKSKSVNKSIQLLAERYHQLNRQFPQTEEESLRTLSALTRKLNIELVSIHPQPKAAFLDADKKEIKIEDKTLQRVFVSLEMNCFYKDLVQYIASLQETVPAFITIERLKISKAGSATPKLNIILDINLCLLS